MRGIGRMFSAMVDCRPRTTAPFATGEPGMVERQAANPNGNAASAAFVQEDDSNLFSTVMHRMTLLDGSEDTEHPEWLKFPAEPLQSLEEARPVWSECQFFPLFPGSPWSCGFEASRLLRYKSETNAPRAPLDRFLKGTCAIFDSIFHEQHLYPSSLYACKELLHVEDLAKYLIPSQAGYADWIYFGVETCVRQLFLDPIFCNSIYKTVARPDQDYDAWGGSHIRTFGVSAEGSIVFSPNNGIYEIAVDWVQPFSWKTYSLGSIFMRSWNVYCALRSKSRFFKCLGIIPGPDEPPSASGPDGYSFQVYVDRIVDDFKSLAQGFIVTDYYNRRFNHVPFLVAFSADTPAGAKVKSWTGHTSCLGCDKCNFQGISYKGAVRFLGYHERSPQYMLYGNDVFWYAFEGARYTSQLLSRIVGTPNSPVHQISRLAELPSFDLVHSVLIPSYHKLLEGVVYNFFKFLHNDMEGDKKGVVSERVGLLRSTIFQGNRLIDPIKYLASHTRENLKFLICICAPFLYIGLVKDYQWDMLLLLHKACVYVLTPRFVRIQRLKEACQQWLRDFANLAEQKFSVAFFTHNLHAVVSHLLEQEDLFGHSYQLTDSWVERCMQFAKRVTKYHAVKDPHTVIGNYILVQNALLYWSNKFCEVMLPSGEIHLPRLFHKLTRERAREVCNDFEVFQAIDVCTARFFKSYYDGYATYDIGKKVVVHANHQASNIYGILLLFVVTGEGAERRQDAVLLLLASGEDGSGMPWVKEIVGEAFIPVAELIAPVDVLWDARSDDGKAPVLHRVFHPYVD